MIQRNILKFLCSVPVIIIIGYFIPFLGICLLIASCFVHRPRKSHFINIAIIIVGVLFLIPKGLNEFKISVPYLSDFGNLEIYSNIASHGEFLVTAGIIFLILSFIFKKFLYKLRGLFNTFLNRSIVTNAKMHAEVSRENDMKMKIQKEASKNTNVIYCPSCGADNIFTGPIGTCKYCRRSLNNKS